MTHWPDNDIWNPRDTHNRAPRPALVECEPLRHRYRCGRVMRWVVKFILYAGFFVVIMMGLFYYAK